eukprot:763053-Hanusia_phi.AAC.9
MQVIPGSASDLGGLRQGDYIVAIDGSKTSAMQLRDLVQYINTKKSHAVMMFEVLPRDSNEVQTLWIHRFVDRSPVCFSHGVCRDAAFARQSPIRASLSQGEEK